MKEERRKICDLDEEGREDKETATSSPGRTLCENLIVLTKEDISDCMRAGLPLKASHLINKLCKCRGSTWKVFDEGKGIPSGDDDDEKVLQESWELRVWEFSDGDGSERGGGELTKGFATSFRGDTKPDKCCCEALLPSRIKLTRELVDCVFNLVWKRVS